jgi:hypothetical protein
VFNAKHVDLHCISHYTVGVNGKQMFEMGRCTPTQVRGRDRITATTGVDVAS